MYWSWEHRPPFIWKSDAKTWGPERQQGEKDGSTVCSGLVDEKYECSELHFAEKSLNWTQSRRAASKLASWSIYDAKVGEYGLSLVHDRELGTQFKNLKQYFTNTSVCEH